MSRRKISVKELGKLDYQGWLCRKKEARGFLGSKWKKYWFVLKNASLYWYTEPTADKADGYINLADFTTEQAPECKRKHAMKASNPCITTLYFAADSIKEMNKWLHMFAQVTKQNNQPESNSGAQSQDGCYSEESDNEEVTDSPNVGQIMLDDQDGLSPADSVETSSEATHSAPCLTVSETPRSDTLSPAEFPQSWLHKAAESTRCLAVHPQQAGTDADPNRGPQHGSVPRISAAVVRSADHSQGTATTLPSLMACGEAMPAPNSPDPPSGQCDEMERLYFNLKQLHLHPAGTYKPSSVRDFKASFIKRCRNEALNEKLHLIRTLKSTLKAREADLMVIEQLLSDPCFTSKQYRQWKEANVLLLQDICLHYRPLEGSGEHTDPVAGNATSCDDGKV